MTDTQIIENLHDATQERINAFLEVLNRYNELNHIRSVVERYRAVRVEVMPTGFDAKAVCTVTLSR